MCQPRIASCNGKFQDRKWMARNVQEIKAVALYLLPYDPSTKKRTTAIKCTAVQISSVKTAEVSVTAKKSIGKSRAHFHHHTNDEYTKLTYEQKKKLAEWRGESLPETEKARFKKNKPKTHKLKRTNSKFFQLLQKKSRRYSPL